MEAPPGSPTGSPSAPPLALSQGEVGQWVQWLQSFLLGICSPELGCSQPRPEGGAQHRHRGRGACDQRQGQDQGHGHPGPHNHRASHLGVPCSLAAAPEMDWGLQAKERERERACAGVGGQEGMALQGKWPQDQLPRTLILKGQQGAPSVPLEGGAALREMALLLRLLLKLAEPESAAVGVSASTRSSTSAPPNAAGAVAASPSVAASTPAAADSSVAAPAPASVPAAVDASCETSESAAASPAATVASASGAACASPAIAARKGQVLGRAHGDAHLQCAVAALRSPQKQEVNPDPRLHGHDSPAADNPLPETPFVQLSQPTGHCAVAGVGSTLKVGPSTPLRQGGALPQETQGCAKKRANEERWTPSTEKGEMSTGVVHFMPWLKYGEKRLCRTGRIRSYFKCGRSRDIGCPVRKWVDAPREQDEAPAQLTYVGAHNHGACACASVLPPLADQDFPSDLARACGEVASLDLPSSISPRTSLLEPSPRSPCPSSTGASYALPHGPDTPSATLGCTMGGAETATRQWPESQKCRHTVQCLLTPQAQAPESTGTGDSDRPCAVAFTTSVQESSRTVEALHSLVQVQAATEKPVASTGKRQRVGHGDWPERRQNNHGTHGSMQVAEALAALEERVASEEFGLSSLNDPNGTELLHMLRLTQQGPVSTADRKLSTGGSVLLLGGLPWACSKCVTDSGLTPLSSTSGSCARAEHGPTMRPTHQSSCPVAQPRICGDCPIQAKSDSFRQAEILVPCAQPNKSSSMCNEGGISSAVLQERSKWMWDPLSEAFLP